MFDSIELMDYLEGDRLFINKFDDLRWIGDSVPQRTPDDSSVKLMAEAIASEPWRGPNWMDGV